MRKLLLIITMLSLFKIADSFEYNPNTIYSISEVTVTTSNWDLLIKKIIFVESTNGTNLVGDNGNAIGHLQIWPILVDDVNRILGYDKYTYKDRWDLNKSIEMFNIYQNKYNPTKDINIAASIWNTGPKGRFNTDNWYVDKVNNVDLNLIT